MTEHNRTPEQRARATIDTKLEEAGWRVQSMGKIEVFDFIVIDECRPSPTESSFPACQR